MANAVVTFLESNDNLTAALSPISNSLTYQAVPNIPPTLEQSMAAITTGKFSAMIVLRLYMATLRHPTAGPSKNKSMSPAPV